MSSILTNLFHRKWWKFVMQYRRGQTPWDTNITPPEVMEFIRETAPGKSLDLGCGTGTNAITLARSGWRATGVDFVPQAIKKARQKAAAAGLSIDFHVADVTDLGFLTGPYDYILDIGCLFGLKKTDRQAYADSIFRLLPTDGWYMLYAWMPRTFRGRTTGISEEDVKHLFRPGMNQVKIAVGQEKGFATAWYWFKRH
jgi:cyclopropane fatty-acyl-phospholipid synthase-like methyltransferase